MLSLVNSFFGVKILIPFLSFTSSSPPSGGMDDESAIYSVSSDFSLYHSL